MRDWVQKIIQAGGLLFALIILLVVFRFWVEADADEGLFGGFWRPYNLKIMVEQTALVALCAIGMTFIIIGGGIDLSIGSVVALTSVVAAQTLIGTGSGFAALFAAVAVGIVCGGVVGLLVTRFHLSPFIVTLGMMGIARGVAILSAGPTKMVTPPAEVRSHAVFSLMSGSEGWESAVPLGWLISPAALVVALLTVLGALLLNKTVFGRHVVAIGCNERTAALCGLRVPWRIMQTYLLAGVLAGLAGLFMLSRLTQGSPSSGQGLELEVIAAVVIGGASLSGGVGSVVGAVLGAAIMVVLKLGMSQIEIGGQQLDNEWQHIVIGLVIIVAVGLDQLRQRGLSLPGVVGRLFGRLA